MLKNNESTLTLAREGKKAGYVPFWVVGVLAASQRGENVDAERLEEALKAVGAFKALRVFQAAEGEWYYCSRHGSWDKWIREAMNPVINGRDAKGVCPSLANPKRRSAFLAALSRVEKTWREEYEGTQESLAAPKGPKARRKAHA